MRGGGRTRRQTFEWQEGPYMEKRGRRPPYMEVVWLTREGFAHQCVTGSPLFTFGCPVKTPVLFLFMREGVAGASLSGYSRGPFWGKGKEISIHRRKWQRGKAGVCHWKPLAWPLGDVACGSCYLQTYIVVLRGWGWGAHLCFLIFQQSPPHPIPTWRWMHP